MADVKDKHSGPNGPGKSLYHDEGDGTFSESKASHLRGWDTTDTAWYRVPVDHATGYLLTKTTLSVGAVDLGDVNLTADARGGYSVSSQVALTTVAIVNGSAGKFGGGMFLNLNAAPAYVQVFDTTGAVTLGTTVPTFVFPIPANATAANGAAFIQELSVGIACANGIKVAATTTPTGASTVATALTGFVLYK